MEQNRAYALARPEHAALLVAIVAVLVAGIVAAVILPTAPITRASRENGTLLAPPSDEAFSAAFGEPGAPSAAFGADEAPSNTSPEPPAPEPAPRKPSPAPGPGTPPPPEQGLLQRLQDLLRPPPPPGAAAARALERVTQRLAFR